MARTGRSISQSLSLLLLAGCISVLIFYPLMIRSQHWSAGLGEAKTTSIVLLALPQGKGKHQVLKAHRDTPIQPDPQVLPSADVHSGYLPAASLSQRPVIVQDIDPELPATFHGLLPQTLVLRLLINEYGDVDQVLVEQTALPFDLVAQLQQAFLQTRFKPGQLQGRSVPSALLVELRLGPD